MMIPRKVREKKNSINRKLITRMRKFVCNLNCHEIRIFIFSFAIFKVDVLLTILFSIH